MLKIDGKPLISLSNIFVLRVSYKLGKTAGNTEHLFLQELNNHKKNNNMHHEESAKLLLA